MQFKDYYATMGIARDASQDDIKRAYRKLARKYHPDVSKEPDAEARFKELGEAYEVLKDPEKRGQYDRLGANYQHGQEFRPPPGFEGFDFGGRGSGGSETFSDFFKTVFGEAAGWNNNSRRNYGVDPRGANQHAKLMVDLETALKGGKRTISMDLPSADEHGRVGYEKKTLKVRIPKGIRAGQHIRLAGQGAPGAYGQSGDLFLEVEFEPHALYRVDGSDLHMDLPVTPWEAALGATVLVPTPGGDVEMKIPPNSAAGKKFRLKGKGLPPTMKEVAGDLYVSLQIALPPADSEQAKELYERMRQEFDFDPRAAMRTR